MKTVEYEVEFLQEGSFYPLNEKFTEKDFKKHEGTPSEVIQGWYESWNRSENKRQRRIVSIKRVTTTVKTETLFKPENI